MKVLIIEDETLIARNLRRLIKEVAPDTEVMAVIDSVQGAVKWLGESEPPDLFFADIQLSDGVSFDIFAQVQVDRPIIFTTAYDEYAIRAFKLNSIDYLLKPIDAADLRAAIDKFHRLKDRHAGKPSEIKELIALLETRKSLPFRERFLVHHKSGYIPVHCSAVSCFSKDQIIYLMAADGQKYVTDCDTLDEIEEVVNPASFFRANRQTLLYKSAVESLQRHFTGKIEVRVKGHDMVIDVSRDKAQEFKSWIESD